MAAPHKRLVIRMQKLEEKRLRRFRAEPDRFYRQSVVEILGQKESVFDHPNLHLSW